jgi:hypothetical protein
VERQNQKWLKSWNFLIFKITLRMVPHTSLRGLKQNPTRIKWGVVEKINSFFGFMRMHEESDEFTGKGFKWNYSRDRNNQASCLQFSRSPNSIFIISIKLPSFHKRSSSLNLSQNYFIRFEKIALIQSSLFFNASSENLVDGLDLFKMRKMIKISNKKYYNPK